MRDECAYRKPSDGRKVSARTRVMHGGFHVLAIRHEDKLSAIETRVIAHMGPRVCPEPSAVQGYAKTMFFIVFDLRAPRAER